jgi:hypothetical protein
VFDCILFGIRFLLHSLNYPDMFRHPNAIFGGGGGGGLYVPRKLLQFCLRHGWMWIMVRSVQPAAAGTHSAAVESSDVVRGAHHVTRLNTPIHNIPSTASQLRISQKALGTLLEDANVMPKHVGATIHN